MTYAIEALVEGEWSADAVGTNNVFETREAAEAMIPMLRECDSPGSSDWADAEYRVVEIAA